MLNNKNKILKINSKIKELELLKRSTKYWNISYKLGKELSKIIEKEKPRNILEIGTSNGFSTLFIAKSSSKNSKITTIEIDERRFLEAKKNFIYLNLNNIIQINGEIFELIENKKIVDKFDFVFLDASQKKYLDLIKKLEKFNLLSKKFILVADNIISHNTMDKFLKYMKLNYNCEILEIDSGFLIARNKN